MNAITASSAAIIFATLAASPASALVSDAKVLGLTSSPLSPLVVKSDFVQGHEVIGGVPAREFARLEASKTMAQRYFDVDVIVTLGALALASGAFVAAGVAGGRRRSTEARAVAPRAGWRDEVMQALEEDLAQFTVGLRHAA